MGRREVTFTKSEILILETARYLWNSGTKEFYGFLLAKEIKGLKNSRFLIGYGTLYGALDRLLKGQFLTSRWEEEPPEGRPRRRYYRLTNKGLETNLWN